MLEQAVHPKGPGTSAPSEFACPPGPGLGPNTLPPRPLKGQGSVGGEGARSPCLSTQQGEQGVAHPRPAGEGAAGGRAVST